MVIVDGNLQNKMLLKYALALENWPVLNTSEFRIIKMIGLMSTLSSAQSAVIYDKFKA